MTYNIKLFNLLYVIVAFVPSCAPKPVMDVDPELAPYVNEFMDLSRSKGIDPEWGDAKIYIGDVLQFEAVKQNAKKGFITNAVCHFEGNGYQIVVDRDRWDLFTVTQRKFLIFHELGHCVLFRQHDTEVDKDNVPDSIMYPLSLDNETLEKHYDHYVEELFSQGRS